MPQTFSTPIDPQNRTQAMGYIATRGNDVVLDAFTQTGEIFKFLHVGGAGDVIILGIDMQLIPWYGAPAGSIIPVAGFKVLSAATINGTPRTTTATNITWYGGV
jgi:hypothetical protein